MTPWPKNKELIEMLHAADAADGTLRIQPNMLHDKYEEAAFFYDAVTRRVITFDPGTGGPISVTITGAGRKQIGKETPSFFAKLFGRKS